ncbi:MAG: purine-binding chemotaxis protein CheW [Lachnospiraceae bacterium]|nr:purine-binding chemotaxis protein CheW [Lachnospiraceae bacterium]
MDETKRLLGQQEEMDDGEDRKNTQRGKYMTFKSGPEYFGLEIQYVQQIIQYQSITKIPETEDYIKGLINLRGKIVPVVDVRLRFKQGEYEHNDKTCILVINVKDSTVGLIVEQIAEVVEIKEENILPPPTIGRGDKGHNKYVYGIGKVGNSVKLLLDPEKLLYDEDTSDTEQIKRVEEE